MNTRAIALASALALAGCSSPFDDVFDDIEDREWDRVAARVSAYCATSTKLWIQRTSIEAWREIRQRGHSGPPRPLNPPPALDTKTARGKGPIMMVWCEASTDGQGRPNLPPDSVWRVLVRDWRD